MNKLFEIQSNHDFELILYKVIHNLTYGLRKIEDTSTSLEHGELKAAEDDLRKLIFSSNLDIKKVEETLAVQNFEKKRVEYLLSLLVKEKNKLLYAFLNYHNSGYGETITQSDWLLKLVLGTSELNTLRYPVLQLILSTVDSNGAQKKKLYELSQDMLLKTIQKLEKISEESPP